MILSITLAYEYFAAGNNNYGQLGLGLSESQIPKFQKKNDVFTKEITHIDAGDYHVFAINQAGHVFGWGLNDKYQLATDAFESINKPHRISYFDNKNIKYIDGGKSHSIAMDVNGNVYTWGSNMRGQLIRSTSGIVLEKDPQIVSPSLYNNEIAVKTLAQNDVSYVLTKSGNLYAFGSCFNGICGEVDYNTNKVMFSSKIKRFWVGKLTLFVEAENGEVYSSGENPNSQLCFPMNENDNKLFQEKLRKIDILNVIEIQIGPTHTLMRVDNSILGCGLNMDHQMSATKSDHFITPTHIYTDSKLVSFAACDDGTLLLTNNHLMAIGTSKMGELGTTKTINQEYVIVDLKTTNLAEVICRVDFSIVFSKQTAPSKPKLTTGQIIGTTLGVILSAVAIALGVLIAYCIYLNKKKYQNTTERNLESKIPLNDNDVDTKW